MYLEADFNLLGERAVGEDRLHLGNNCGADDAALLTDVRVLGAHARHDGEVVREVRGEDARDATLVQVLGRLQV